MVGPPPARPAGRGRPGLLTWPRGRVPWVHARENADLAHHGDADLIPGLVDLAVNVRSSGTPSWLAARIRTADLAAYPDQRAAVAAVAARHRRPAGEGLVTAGAPRPLRGPAPSPPAGGGGAAPRRRRRGLRAAGAGPPAPARGRRAPSVHRAGGRPARRRAPGRPGDPAVPVHA